MTNDDKMFQATHLASDVKADWAMEAFSHMLPNLSSVFVWTALHTHCGCIAKGDVVCLKLASGGHEFGRVVCFFRLDAPSTVALHLLCMEQFREDGDYFSELPVRRIIRGCDQIVDSVCYTPASDNRTRIIEPVQLMLARIA